MDDMVQQLLDLDIDYEVESTDADQGPGSGRHHGLRATAWQLREAVDTQVPSQMDLAGLLAHVIIGGDYSHEQQGKIVSWIQHELTFQDVV